MNVGMSFLCSTPITHTENPRGSVSNGSLHGRQSERAED